MHNQFRPSLKSYYIHIMDDCNMLLDNSLYKVYLYEDPETVIMLVSVIGEVYQ